MDRLVHETGRSGRRVRSRRAPGSEALVRLRRQRPALRQSRPAVAVNQVICIH